MVSSAIVMYMSNELLPTQCDPKTMDTSVRPQDDLYRHVNGTWLKTHELPGDKAMDGAFNVLRDESEKQRRDIIDQCVDGTITEGKAKEIGRIYTAFMNEDAIEKAGISPIKPLLDRISATTDRTQLAEVLGDYLRRADAPIPAVGIGVDPNQPDRYVFMVSQGGLGLPDESFYREDTYAPIRDAYVAYIADMLTLAGYDDCDRRAHALMDFETKLAATHWDNVTTRDTDKTNNPMSWADATALAPDFAWDVWAKAAHLPAINDVIVGVPPHLEGFNKLWKETDIAILHDWAIMSVLTSFAPMLSNEFVERRFDFYSRTLTGTQQMRARWKRGVGAVEGQLGEPLGELYVARHFPPDHKQQMEKLVDYLLQAYRDSITTLDWMTDATKERALEKLDLFRTKIGYPDKWRDYSDLTFDEGDTLCDMVMKVSAFDHDYEVAKLGKAVDSHEWHMTPQTVNAYYNPTQNEIVFPAAILQPPFFDPDADPAQNFGAIGAVIGHEIGHGFDDQGAKFDGHGKINNWWSETDEKEFSRRTQSLIDFYNRFSPAQLSDDHRVNGALTIGENIGDLGGLTIAYKAWLMACADAGKAPSREQQRLFFYSWAYVWRTKIRDELAIQLLAVDPHSPAEFRCNGVVSHVDAFADAFDLTDTDGLWCDPDKRVHIW